MRGLAGFQARCRARIHEAASFAALTSERQIEFLHTVDTTPFFEQARLLTLCGMFSSPTYGGNRDGIGWKLMGFEDQHVFEPPFGYYDRGYPDEPRTVKHDADLSRLATPWTSSSSARAPRAASSRASSRAPARPWWCSSRARASTPADFEHDELKNWFIGRHHHRHRSAIRRPSAVDASQTAAAPLVRPPLLYARGVGGTTLHYTANYWRFHEIDFRERSVLGAISGTGFADWPISYAELEPYYTKVDWEIGVSGLAGANPVRSAAQRARIPCRRCRVKSSGVLFERGARKLGLHPVPAPLAINSVAYGGRPGLRALRLLPWLRAARSWPRRPH